MRKLPLIIFLFIGIGMYAQDGIVRGHILDKEMDNEPLLFANIELKGTSANTQSNLFGKFEMTNVAPGNYILTISFAGYKTGEVPIEVAANEVTEVQYGLGAEQVSFDELELVRETSKNSENLTLSSGKKR